MTEAYNQTCISSGHLGDGPAEVVSVAAPDWSGVELGDEAFVFMRGRTLRMIRDEDGRWSVEEAS